MIIYKSGCVDCGLPCIGTACKYHSEAHYYCDDCRCEIEHYDEVYELYGMHYCPKCARQYEEFDDEFKDDDCDYEEDESEDTIQPA